MIGDKSSRAQIRVGLYVAVSSQAENLPAARTPFGALKSLIGRSIDMLHWHLLRRPKVSFYHWNTRLGTNKGDAAIRETIKTSIRQRFHPNDIVFDELQWGTLAGRNVDDLYRDWDLLIVGGSGYIATDERGDLARRVRDDFAVLRQLHCPKILYGIGWNTLLTASGEAVPLSDGAKALLQEILAGFDVLSVRDRATESLLHDLSPKPVFLTGDPALFFEPPDHYPSIPKVPGKLQLGLNFAIHGPNSARRFERKFDEHCELLRRIARQYPVTFHYVQHAYTERFIPQLLRSRGLAVHVHDPNPAQLTSFYRQLDVHICEMMHSSILAINAGTPTLCLAYDVKNIGFFDVMGLSEYCHPVWNLDHERFLQSVDKAVRENSQIRQKIAARTAELRRRYQMFLTEVYNNMLVRDREAMNFPLAQEQK